MPDQPLTLDALAAFHREVILPDVERVVGRAVVSLRDEMQTHFDGIVQRLDRLETEYEMIKLGLRRIEDRLDGLDKKVDELALRSELVALKTRVDGLQEQVRQLEARLDG